MLDLTQLNQALARGLHQATDYLAEACQDNLEAEIWEWNNTTLRKNGEVVFSPRDIIDTGELYDSQYIERTDNQDRIIYDAEHAHAVHNGDGLLPGRPWIALAVEENQEEILQEFINGFKKNA